MHPSPSGETVGPFFPSFRGFIAPRLHYNPRRADPMARTIGLLIVVVAVATVGAQEHSYTQADVENGARIYQSRCAGCHGPNGDMVPGIELQRAQFRRATSDPEVIAIIRSGIPGTTMPPSSFTETQAGSIVAYLRSTAMASGRGGRGGAITVARGDAA